MQKDEQKSRSIFIFEDHLPVTLLTGVILQAFISRMPRELISRLTASGLPRRPPWRKGTVLVPILASAQPRVPNNANVVMGEISMAVTVKSSNLLCMAGGVSTPTILLQ